MGHPLCERVAERSVSYIVNGTPITLTQKNLLDLIHIPSGLAWKQWPEVGSMILALWLASGLDLFAKPCQPEPTQIWTGSVQYDPGCLWKNATESESGKLGAGR